MNQEISSKIIKSARIISVMTLLSRIFGYFRDRCMSVYLGTGTEADAFTIAFLIPNVLRRLFGEGSMTAAFLPTFSDFIHKKGQKDSWEFARIFFWNLTIVLIIVVILGIIFSPFIVKIIAPGFKGIEGKTSLTINLNRVLFPFILLVSITALQMAILNTFSIFGLPAATQIFFNIAIIASALLFTRYFTHPSYAFVIGVLLGGIVQFIMQMPRLSKLGMPFVPKCDFHHPGAKKVGLLMIPGFFAISIAQINIFIGQYYASGLAEGSVSSIYYADRIMELALGVYAIAISTVILPMLSKFAAQDNMSDFKDTLCSAIKLNNIIMLPAAVGLIFFKEPIVEVLFKQGKFTSSSAQLTSVALLYFAIGLPGFALVKIIVSAFYSLKDTLTPVLVGCISIVTNLLFINIFIHKIQHGSIPFASSLSSYINFTVLFFILMKRRGKINLNPLFISFAKMLFASLIMGILSHYLLNTYWIVNFSLIKKAVYLLVFMILDLACYAGTLFIIARQDLIEFIQIFKFR